MQRILQPGEIEGLDHTHFPRILLPVPATLFAERAARLAQLAADHPIGDYLRLVTALVRAQQQLANSVHSNPIPPEVLARNQEFGLPLAPAAEHLDPQWQSLLAQLLELLQAGGDLPEAVQPALHDLQQSDAAARDALAQRLLSHNLQPNDLAAAPFVAAALQLILIDRASRLSLADIPYTDPATICPVCASQPVASVLRIGGAMAGHRYLHCGICCTEWHMVRVKCSHCESTKGIRYQGVAGDKQVVQAETCSECGTYRKLVNQETDPLAEPLADELAALRLDLLMGATEFARASTNPLLALAAAAPPAPTAG